MIEAYVCVCVCVCLHSCGCEDKFMQDCGKLQGSISYFLATRFLQMNAEAASDVDTEY